MKKVFLFAIFSLITLLLSSQTLVKSTLNGDSYSVKETNYVKYVGVAADTLNGGLDSIQFPVQLHQSMTYKFDVGAVFTKRASNDTLIVMTVYGKKFDDEATWTRITSGHSANVTSTTGTQATLSYGTAVQYRLLKIDFQIIGTKSTGVKIKSWELKIWNQ